jgi:hypothetical protein
MPKKGQMFILGLITLSVFSKVFFLNTTIIRKISIFYALIFNPFFLNRIWIQFKLYAMSFEYNLIFTKSIQFSHLLMVTTCSAQQHKAQANI